MSTRTEDENEAEEAEAETAHVKHRKAVKAKQAQIDNKAKKVAKPNGKATKVVAKAKKVKATKKRAPRNVDQSKLDKFGFRLNSKKHEAAIMYAAKKGATLAEVKKALKSTQFNLLTELEEKGYTIKRTAIAGNSGRLVTRFQIMPN